MIEQLPSFLASYIDDEAAAAANVARITELTRTWSADTLAEVQPHLAALGQEMRVYPAHPALRTVARQWCRDVLTEAVVEGVEHLRAVQGPRIVVGNHLTYFDTTATDAALTWSDAADLADGLVTAAGPKVYATMFRRFASGCLNTLTVPQSNAVASEEMSARELARRAIQSLKAARSAVESGMTLQIYPEGTRSRDGRFGPFLKATWRYLNVPGAHVVPMALTGTDAIMPVGAEKLTPGPIRVQFGAPIPVEDPRNDLAKVWHAIAEMLPEHLAPGPDTEPLR